MLEKSGKGRILFFGRILFWGRLLFSVGGIAPTASTLGTALLWRKYYVLLYVVNICILMVLSWCKYAIIIKAESCLVEDFSPSSPRNLHSGMSTRLGVVCSNRRLRDRTLVQELDEAR